MKTTNKLHPVWAYLESSINEEYFAEMTGKEFATATMRDKWQFVADCFKNWYCPYEQRMNKNYQAAFAAFLQTSPGCVSIAEYYHEILAIAKSWGSIPQNATEKQEQKIIDNYYPFMAAKFMQAMAKHKVSIY